MSPCRLQCVLCISAQNKTAVKATSCSLSANRGGVLTFRALLSYQYGFANWVNAGDCANNCASQLYSHLIKSKQFGSSTPTYARVRGALPLLLQHEAATDGLCLIEGEPEEKRKKRQICYFWRRYAFRSILQRRKLFPNHPVLLSCVRPS